MKNEIKNDEKYYKTPESYYPEINFTFTNTYQNYAKQKLSFTF